MTELHPLISGDTPEYSLFPHLGEHIVALRADLLEKLGCIVLAEQHLPPVITDGLYDKTLDELRETTERSIDLRQRLLDVAAEQALRDGYSHTGTEEIRVEL